MAHDKASAHVTRRKNPALYMLHITVLGRMEVKAATIVAVLLIAAQQSSGQAGAERGVQCAFAPHVFEHEFIVLAENMGLVDNNEVGDSDGKLPSDVLHDFAESLILELNLTSSCCFDDHNETNSTDHDDRPIAAKAYGYGFLMVMLVSATSILGIAIVPFVKGNRCKDLYKYVYALMISLGASALFCDAVLHLLPEVFDTHVHTHFHIVHDDHNDFKQYLWKGCAVVGGMYIFFLLEVFLHSWNQHKDHNTSTHEKNATCTLSSDGSLSLIDNQEPSAIADGVSEGRGRDYGSTPNTGVVSSATHTTNKSGCLRRICCYLWNMKPLAWIIIIGDTLHNFADGLALGAAISESLALGISTTIALVFHEIPHELGDFAILLSTGMHWGIALLFSIFSSVTALVGFFIGVAVGTTSHGANQWILAVTAGIFFYIALVDLLPVLIHSKEKGCERCGVFVAANIGLGLSFAVLLVIALYEDDISNLVE